MIRRRRPCPGHERHGQDPIVQIPRSDVEGGFPNNISRMNILRTSIAVDALGPEGATMRSFYAAESNTYAKTVPTFGIPHEETKLVCRNDKFEIEVLGMQVSRYDSRLPWMSHNELMMFSIHHSSEENVENAANMGDQPYIHFDYTVGGSMRPNKFVDIDPSKRFVTGREKDSGDSSVNVQFKIIEIDKQIEPIKQALAGLDNIEGMASGFGSLLPYLGLVSPVLGIASAVGRRAINARANPDKVLSVDMNFLLAEKYAVKKSSLPAGNYLRYGYYFFMRRPHDAKLYASVHTPENVRLMVHRSSASSARNQREKEYLPMTGVDYLVIKVSKPAGNVRVRPRFTVSDRRRRDSEIPGNQPSNIAEQTSRPSGPLQPPNRHGEQYNSINGPGRTGDNAQFGYAGQNNEHNNQRPNVSTGQYPESSYGGGQQQQLQGGGQVNFWSRPGRGEDNAQYGSGGQYNERNNQRQNVPTGQVPGSSYGRGQPPQFQGGGQDNFESVPNRGGNAPYSVGRQYDGRSNQRQNVSTGPPARSSYFDPGLVSYRQREEVYRPEDRQGHSFAYRQSSVRPPLWSGPGNIGSYPQADRGNARNITENAQYRSAPPPPPSYQDAQYDGARYERFAGNQAYGRATPRLADLASSSSRPGGLRSRQYRNSEQRQPSECPSPQPSYRGARNDGARQGHESNSDCEFSGRAAPRRNVRDLPSNTLRHEGSGSRQRQEVNSEQRQSRECPSLQADYQDTRNDGPRQSCGVFSENDVSGRAEPRRNVRDLPSNAPRPGGYRSRLRQEVNRRQSSECPSPPSDYQDAQNDGGSGQSHEVFGEQEVYRGAASRRNIGELPSNAPRPGWYRARHMRDATRRQSRECASPQAEHRESGNDRDGHEAQQVNSERRVS